jgi:hypothetical protein
MLGNWLKTGLPIAPIVALFGTVGALMALYRAQEVPLALAA